MSGALWFALGIVSVGIVLVARQFSVRQHLGTGWVHSLRRYYRRLIMGFLFVVIGALLLADESGYFPMTGNAVRLMIYVSVLGGLSLFLVLLALADVWETMRMASGEMAKLTASNPEVADLLTQIQKNANEAKQRISPVVSRGDDNDV